MTDLLTPAVRSWLEGPRYAVLATLNPSGSPHITEMWYELRGDEIIFNTTADRAKPRNVEHDARVSLLVSQAKGQPTLGTTTYVRIDGRARRVADGAKALDDIRRMAVHYDGEAAAERAVQAYAKQQRVSYAITIRRVYAKGF